MSISPLSVRGCRFGVVLVGVEGRRDSDHQEVEEVAYYQNQEEFHQVRAVEGDLGVKQHASPSQPADDGVQHPAEELPALPIETEATN